MHAIFRRFQLALSLLLALACKISPGLAELADFPTEVQRSLLEKAGVKYQIVELTC